MFEPRPGVLPPREWNFPVPKRRVLDNGMTVLAFQRDGQHIASAELVLDVPLTGEPADREGVGTLTQRCLAEGTRTHPGSDFATAVDSLGAVVDGLAGHSATQLMLEVPAARLAPGLALLAESLIEPELADADVERLREIRLAEIDQELANSAHRAAVAFRSAVMPGRFRAARPSGGLAETVANVETADVVAFHERYRPPGATLVLAGDFASDPFAAAEAAFGGWSAAPGELPVHETPVARPATCQLIDRPGAVQADVRLGGFGLDRADPDHAALAVACHALGGSFLSRLNRELREERGFTYGVHLVNHPLRTGGLVAVQGSFRTGVVAEALERARDILDVRAAPITDAEVAKAVSYARGVAPLQYSTAPALAGGVATLAADGLTYEYVDEHARALGRVTPESATAALQRVLPPDRLTLVVVGDAETLAEPLRAAGWLA